jgi:antirestriction protein ArdC
MTSGYSESRWVTFRQAELLGGHVRKGERSTRVIFWKTLDVTRTDATTGEKVDATVPMLRTYCVFNVAQCDGIGSAAPAAPSTVQEGAWQASLDAIVGRIGVQVTVSDRACYVPASDAVRMPAAETFRSRADHAATFLHELVHASGAKHRLDRDLSGRFGSEAYAAEELVAELGSAFLCAMLGVDGKLQHAEYVASWIRLLQNDKRAIFKASSLAQAAANYLLGTSKAVEETPAAAEGGAVFA